MSGAILAPRCTMPLKGYSGIVEIRPLWAGAIYTLIAGTKQAPADLSAGA